MKTNSFGRYDYAELLAAATDPNAQQIDIDTLGAWFERYGSMYWTGDDFDADGRRLARVEEWDEDNDQGHVVGYEWR